jgi:hypothetical protein
MYTDEFLGSCSLLPNIIMIKSRLRWAGHVAHMGETKMHTGQPEGKRLLVRPRHRWGIILKWYLK